MEKIPKHLGAAAMVSVIMGGVSGAVTFGGRYFTKYPQLSYLNAVSTAVGFGTSFFVCSQLKSNRVITAQPKVIGTIIGGIALATAVNKRWLGRDLSILQNGVTPTVTVLSMIAGVITAVLCED